MLFDKYFKQEQIKELRKRINQESNRLKAYDFYRQVEKLEFDLFEIEEVKRKHAAAQKNPEIGWNFRLKGKKVK